MRTVELIGFDVGTSIPADKLQSAVGYLSMWGLGGYSRVRIVFDAKHKELIASYWEWNGSGTRPGYGLGAICAVWHEDRGEFSFHS